jgi:hypothetical protein
MRKSVGGFSLESRSNFLESITLRLGRSGLIAA